VRGGFYAVAGVEQADVVRDELVSALRQAGGKGGLPAPELPRKATTPAPMRTALACSEYIPAWWQRVEKMGESR